MEDEPRPIPNLPCFVRSESLDDVEDDDKAELEGLATIADGIDDVDMFRFFLQELLNGRFMTSKRAALQFIIENENGYDLEKMKGAFDALILKAAA